MTQHDPSIGQFAVIYPGVDSRPGEAAIIEMPGLTTGQDYCLEFYYHMHGSDIGELTVGVDFDSPSIFTVEGGRSRFFGCGC